MRLQKLWVAFACVLLLVLPAMAADASISGLPTGSARLSGGGSYNLTALDVTPPPVPDDIKVPAGNEAFLVGHAIGTQNYVCLPSGSGFAFALFTPQATLFDDKPRQIITHYFSPNLSPSPNQPQSEKGTIRATWQDSKDTSTVWAKATGSVIQPDAVAWVRLEVVGAQDGPTGGDTLTDTTFVQRLNTSGGLAPSTGCASTADVGHTAFVPYTADYYFFRKAG